MEKGYEETGELATCVRVAVVGTYPNENSLGWDRFLAHVDELEKILSRILSV